MKTVCIKKSGNKKFLKKKCIVPVVGILLIGIMGITGCGTEKATSNIISDMEITEPSSMEQVKEMQETPTQDKEANVKKQEEEKAVKEEASGNSNKKFSEAGALQVIGAQLSDSKGEPIQLRGTSTHGLAWFPQYVNRDFFLELSKEWNVNVIRLAMYTAENGGYCTDGNKEHLKQLVKDGIRYATEADLYVIVDWHVLRDENPHTYKEEAKKFFEEISGEFAEYENIIYEICNEPNGNVSWLEIKSYAEEIIPVIQENDADAVIIVGTPTWSQDVDKAAANPITAYDNVMYALHFYATTHTDWLRERMVNAINAGLPVFVSEFGTCDASGSGGIDYAQSKAWIQKMDEYRISYVTWNLSNKGETSAIFVANCPKTSGFVREDLSENGKWIFEMLTGEYTEMSDAKKVQVQTQTKEQSKEKKNVEEGKQAETKKEEIAGKTEDVQYTANISNSWEAEGKFFYQYSLTLKNISGEEIESWKVELNFSDVIKLSDGWNGNYTEKGEVLEITSKDYNGKVKPEGEVTDVGFIISGGADLQLILME